MEATTPTALKNKVTALAELANPTSGPAVLDMDNYVDANGKAYLTELAKPATVKNTAGAINTVLTTVNAAEATKLVDAVKAEANAATVDADKLLTALNNLGLKQVASTNKDLYKAETGFKTIADKNAAQVLVDTQNLEAVVAATESTIIAKLNVFGLDNIVAANAKAYETAKVTIGGVMPDAGGDNAKTVALVKAQVKIVNDQVTVDVLVKVIEESTDVAETEQALVDLANLGKVTNFLATPKADRTFVAEELVAIEDRTDVDTEGEINTAVGTANTTITNALTAINALDNTSNEVATITALENVKVFDDLVAIAKKDVANAFIAEVLEVLKTGENPNFKSYTELSSFIETLM